MAKRKRNPRVVALERLMQAKGWLHDLTMTWRVSGKVYVDHADRKPGDNAYLRDRLPHEYPENDPEALRRLLRYTAAIRVRLDEVDDLMRDRLTELNKAGNR